MKNRILIPNDDTIKLVMRLLSDNNITYSIETDSEMNGNSHSTMIFVFTKVKDGKIIELREYFRTSYGFGFDPMDEDFSEDGASFILKVKKFLDEN